MFDQDDIGTQVVEKIVMAGGQKESNVVTDRAGTHIMGHHSSGNTIKSRTEFVNYNHTGLSSQGQGLFPALLLIGLLGLGRRRARL